jgi:hypothetical protein
LSFIELHNQPEEAFVGAELPGSVVMFVQGGKLIPEKNKRYSSKAEDCLVEVAEDET